MSRPIVTDALCEALFASALQRCDAADLETVAYAIRYTVRRLGPGGCASKMAQEFGEHPEAACDRMRWARQLIAQFSACPAAPATGLAAAGA